MPLRLCGQRVDMSVEVILLCVLIAIAILTVLALELKRHSQESKDKRAEHRKNVIALLEEYEEWNEIITTKDNMKAYYGKLNETCLNVFGKPLSINLTKEEFDELSLSSIRELNRQALAVLKDSV